MVELFKRRTRAFFSEYEHRSIAIYGPNCSRTDVWRTVYQSVVIKSTTTITTILTTPVYKARMHGRVRGLWGRWTRVWSWLRKRGVGSQVNLSAGSCARQVHFPVECTLLHFPLIQKFNTTISEIILLGVIKMIYTVTHKSIPSPHTYNIL